MEEEIRKILEAALRKKKSTGGKKGTLGRPARETAPLTLDPVTGFEPFGLAGRMKQFRETLGLNRDAVAQMLGVSVAALQSYEDAAATPGADVVYQYARLGADPMWLLTGKSDSIAMNVLEVAEIKALIIAFLKVSLPEPEKIKQLDTMADLLCRKICQHVEMRLHPRNAKKSAGPAPSLETMALKRAMDIREEA